MAPALLGLAWIGSQSVTSPLRADEPVEALVVPVGSTIRDNAVSVTVTVEHSAPFQVTGAVTGVVTAVRASPGTELATGDPVLEVEDQVLVAYTADSPLWRDLGLGDEGPDVERLQSVLSDLDLTPGSVTGRVTPATVEAVRRLNSSLGRGDNEHVLRREALLWVGPEPLVVGEVLVRAGESVTAGQPLVRGLAQLASVVVTPPDGRSWPETDHVLAVSGVEVSYDPAAERVVDPDAVAAVAGALRGSVEGTGTVRLARPEEVGAMPAAAVVTDANGHTCVFDSASGPPTRVEVLGGSLSTVSVSASWIGRPVLVNPREVRADLSCA